MAKTAIRSVNPFGDDRTKFDVIGQIGPIQLRKIHGALDWFEVWQDDAPKGGCSQLAYSFRRFLITAGVYP